MATGFIGIGIMGEGMTTRLLSQGVAGNDNKNPLIIWNRTPSKCEALKEQFPDKKIIIKETPREVVESCKITYSMLSTPQVSKLVFEGEDGVLAGVSEGKSIVDCATLAEEDMKRMNEAVTAKGGYVLLLLLSFICRGWFVFNGASCCLTISFDISFILDVFWKPQSLAPRYRLQWELSFSFVLDQKKFSMKSRILVCKLWAKPAIF